MELVNPLSAYPIGQQYEDILGVEMKGIPEKQGVAFSAHGWRQARDHGGDADAIGAAVRRAARPHSAPMLERARAEYMAREIPELSRYVIVENTAICNKACPFCSIHVVKRYDENGNPGKLVLEWRDFYKLMAEYGQHEGHYGISLYGLGEPTLWRGKDERGNVLDIADMVDCAKKVGGFRAVNVSTNADVSNLHRLLECDLDDLIISVDGMSESVYLQNRPSAKKNDMGAFDRTLERVHDFLKLKAKTGQTKPFVRLQIINMASTAHQVLDFVKYWIKIPGVDDVFCKNLDAMASWVETPLISAEESKIKMEHVGSMACQHVFAILTITASGQFVACCHDARSELWERLPDGRVPHIRSITAAEWWNGEFMTKLRGEHSAGAFRAPCKTCHERDPWLGNS